MKVDEDQLKQQIRSSLEKSNKKFLIDALLYCYYCEEEDLEGAEKQFDVGRGEAAAASGSFDEMFEQLQYELRTRGRQFALVLILGNLFQYFGYGIRHKILTMVEMCEIDRLVQNHQYMEANLRLCSFLENILEEQNEEAQSHLYWKINTAGDEGVLTQEQEKIAQCIRDTRNDAAHNFWMETEWSYVIHEFAAIASLTLLDNFLNENLGVTSWPVEPQLDMSRALRVVEGEFGFEWDSDSEEWSNGPREKYEREYSW